MSAAMTLQKLLLVLVVPLGFLPVTLSLGIPVSHLTDAYKKPVATQRAPAPTPAPVFQNQIFRRAPRTCGVLQGGYPDSDGPPVCSEGSACTFTSNSGYQGCCQEGSCTFYTTCYAYSDQGSCTGSCTSSGLVCPSSAPECTQYFYQNELDSLSSSWTGFACGAQAATSPPIWAWAVNGLEATATGLSDTSSGSQSSTSTTTSSPSLPSSRPTSNLSPLPDPTGPTSSTTSTSSTGQAAATTSGVGNTTLSQSHNHTGVIAGGVTGGLAAIALLVGLFACLQVVRKKRERSGMATNGQREIGRWN